MGSKLSSIQILRGIAASLVVVLHILASMDTYYHFSIITNYPILAAFLESGVDVFFVISGFIMFTVTQNKFGQGYAWTFIKKRAFRVLPLYWTLTLLYVALLLLIPSAFNTSSFDLLKLTQSLLFIPHLNNSGDVMPVVSVGWTLNFEMYFYVCFAIALLFSKKAGLFLALIIITLGLVFQSVSGFNHVALSIISNSLILEFLMGVLASIVYSQIYANKERLAITLNRRKLNIIGCTILLLLILYWVVFYEYVVALQLPRFIIWGVPSVLLLIIFISFEPLIKNWKGGVFIGDISYSLYLIQVFTLPVVIKIAMLTSLNSLLFIIFVGLCQYVISIIAATWSYKLIEIPLTRYLNSNFASK